MSFQSNAALFTLHRDAIAALPPGELSRGDVLDGRFAVAAGDGFNVHYAPFDHINAEARVVLVGLSPGWQQTKLAFEIARERLDCGDSDERVLWTVKQHASFAGMRKRLARWLDGIGVGRALGLASAAELFAGEARLLHTTSAVRYPVFCAGNKNWSGTNPSVTEPALRDITRTVLGPELRSLPAALVVPLGVAVQSCLRDLVERGDIDPDRCLFGFPHPSGANASGARRYADAQPRLQALVARWAGMRAPRTPGERPEPLRAPSATSRSTSTERPAAVANARLPDRAGLQKLMLDALTALDGRAHRHAIKSKATELGLFTRDQLAIPAPPSKRGQYPNQLTYQLDWALNALHRQQRVQRVGSGEWALA